MPRPSATWPPPQLVGLAAGNILGRFGPGRKEGDRTGDEGLRVDGVEGPDSFNTLAAAYAESGKFEDAVEWQKKALEHPEVFGAREA